MLMRKVGREDKLLAVSAVRWEPGWERLIRSRSRAKAEGRSEGFRERTKMEVAILRLKRIVRLALPAKGSVL